MGTECACLGQEALKAQAVEKENENSKFFYYSDPQLLTAFQEKLSSIQKNINQQKRQREKQGAVAGSEQRWNVPSHLNRTLGTTMTTQASSQLRQLDARICKESISVMQNLEVEKQSGWKEAIPQRLVLEVGQVQGLWSTSDSWFTQCRSLVQVEYAGFCFNTKPNSNVKDPYFAELHVFPTTEALASENFPTKVFISILTVEGQTRVAEMQGEDHSRMTKDRNVYKRIAEYCLDIRDICEDQLVHDLILTLPVKSKDPVAEPLFHKLRNCELSGFNDLSGMTDDNFDCFGENGADAFNLPSPPIQKDFVRQMKELPIYESPGKTVGGPLTDDKDVSLLRILSEIEVPDRPNQPALSQPLNEQATSKQHHRESEARKFSEAIHTTTNRRNALLAPTPKGQSARHLHQVSPPKQKIEISTPAEPLKVFEQNLHSLLPSTKQRQRTIQRLQSDGEHSVSSKGGLYRTGTFAAHLNKGRTDVLDENFSNQVGALDENSTASRKFNSKLTASKYFQSPDVKDTRGYKACKQVLDTFEQEDLKTRRSTFYTPADHKSRKQLARNESNQLVKAMPWEEAVALPCQSFSFDDEFQLDSDGSRTNIDENWSPIAMGNAPVSIENRVSPCKPFRESPSPTKSTGLLGGVFPVLKKNRVLPFAGDDGTVAWSTTGAAEMTAPKEGEVKMSLRIQYLQNSTEQLLKYKEKLQQTSKVVRKLDRHA